jgi:hypothetical protein
MRSVAFQLDVLGRNVVLRSYIHSINWESQMYYCSKPQILSGSSSLLVAAMTLLGSSHALAGSGIGIEMGAGSIQGSGAGAYESSAAVRVHADIVPADVYQIQFVYGFTNYTLTNPTALIEAGEGESVADVDWLGSLEMHYAGVHYKVYPDIGLETGKKRLSPFVGSGFGLVFSRGRVTSNLVPAVMVDTTATNLMFEIFTGLDVNLGALSLGVNGHVGFIPGIQLGVMESSGSMTMPVTTTVSGALAF